MLTRRILCCATLCYLILAAAGAFAADRVKTVIGTLEGAGPQPNGVRIFRGVPFAAPPIGDFRWKEPQPVAKWKGARAAAQFGPRCMQQPLFGDMVFRSNGVKEDCLYLNIWTPAKPKAKPLLPVLVYFYGGGYVAGDGSESRYEGESMATKGIVALTVNYRLGIFGFMAHPALTAESPHHASGNYGLLDQAAALRWVHENIANFGGDPKRVTIAGESAGSTSVSAQMSSPLSRNLIAGAIGESGSLMGTLTPQPLATAEKAGADFATSQKADSLAALRAIPAEKLMDAAGKMPWGTFSVTIDGYFFEQGPGAIYAAGAQAKVPLLLGWNSQEGFWKGLLLDQEPTPENYAKAVAKQFPANADEVLKAYGASTPDEVKASGTALESDLFIGFSTWKWADLHASTGGGQPMYRYFYTHPRPAAVGKSEPDNPGAVHSAEIEYAMGNLGANKAFQWTPDDYKVSATLQGYFVNFIKSGNPNGAGLPEWPAMTSDASRPVMRIDVDSGAAPEQHRDRYLLLGLQGAK